MADLILEKLFEMDRWEAAIENAVEKGMDKAQLRNACYPEFRRQMFRAITERQYEIAPPVQRDLPKDDGGIRTVYVNTTVDRLFLSMVNDILMELCGPCMIHPSCKSYQKGIGCGQVVREASLWLRDQRATGNGEEICGFKADISKYFDSVERKYIEQVFERIERITGPSKVIDIIRNYYRSDLCISKDGKVLRQYQGLKQGSAVASFLADALLYELDRMMTEQSHSRYARYSDDILLVSDHCEKLSQQLDGQLSEYSLHIKQSKFQYIDNRRWITFLGFALKGDGTQISLSASRVRKFQDMITGCTIRSLRASGKSQEKAARLVRSVQRELYYGNGRYSWATSVLPVVNCGKDLRTMDIYIKDCIRAASTGKTRIGGLGTDVYGKEGFLIRGTGRNVRANRQKTDQRIEGYYSLSCMRNAYLSSRQAYDALIRSWRMT